MRRLRVWRELRLGPPSLLSYPPPDAPLFTVLKPGSFGAPDFLAEAVRHLKEAPDVLS